jgi:pyrroloquinoline-quinone synthase
MEEQTFWEGLNERIARYDLLCHPFYKAWSAGELTRDDLREYSAQYYHHVAAFPTYLSALHSRLTDGTLRRAVLRNLYEEELDGAPHSELWLDFAEGMGNDREAVRKQQAIPEVGALMQTFRNLAQEHSTASALGAFYAYESQVPRIAEVKARGLRELYGADEGTCRYFVLHTTLDVGHAFVWRRQLQQVVNSNSSESCAAEALQGAEQGARALWAALDGIEARRNASRN